VSERLKSEFDWEPRLTDPDLAVAKGAALYAAGQTVRFVEADQGRTSGESGEPGKSGLAAAGPVTDEAVRAVARQSGLDEERVRDLASRTVINVLPKSIGIKLVDTTKPNWEADIDSAFYIEHLVDAQTQLAFPGRTFVANTLTARQEEIEIEIWEQAGATPSPDMTANHRVDEGGVIRGLGSFALPAGSPINIDIDVDAEGTVHLRAVEPTSTHDVEIAVRISILSQEQVAEAKIAHAGLTVST
jgi:molecular chaperone DnaK